MSVNHSSSSHSLASQSAKPKRIQKASAPLSSFQSKRHGILNTYLGRTNLNDPDVDTEADPENKSNFSVRDTLRGQNFFITGASGFLGKVLLEKILRSIPDSGRIFLLIRPSRGRTAEERLQEMVASECFNRLRKERSDFDQFVRSKLTAISGELTRPHAGISEPDLRMLSDSANVVIHCAASIDFNERIDRALELNVFGTKRIFDLARDFSSLRAFIHISTCYVNVHMAGLLHEEIYPLSFSVDEVIDKVSRMNASEMNTLPVLTDLLGDYPNTYTFTKSITEHLLLNERGEVPMAIVRPSIIGAAIEEPVPGWVDTVSAAGAPILAAGLGVLKYLPGKRDGVLDVIPVDHVVSSILACIPDIFCQDTLKVYASASSCVNPTTIGDIEVACVDFFKQHPSSHAFAPFSFKTIESPQMYELAFFCMYSVPAAVLNTIARFGTDRQKRLANSYERLVSRARSISHRFNYFTENSWLFDSSNTIRLRHRLCPEEQRLFPMDVNDIDWSEYHQVFAYGLLRYVLKEDIVEIPNTRTEKFIPLQLSQTGYDKSALGRLMPDLDWSYRTHLRHPQRPVSRPLQEMHESLFAAPRVQAAIESAAKLEDVSRSSVEKRVHATIERLCGDVDHKVLIGFGWLLKKIFKAIYESIHVNQRGIDAIKNFTSTSPIVLLPTHRSYVDFLVCSFVCFVFQLPMPYIAAGEDFLGIMGVRWLFRKSGAFFIRRSFTEDPIYQVIFDEYIALLLGDQHCIEFFIEGTRSRSGKMLHPKLGLLKSVTDVYFDKKVEDIQFIPLSINYEKTLEGNLYGNELLGDSKIKESLRSLLSSAAVLSANFGRIIVKICDPISLKDYTESYIPRAICEANQTNENDDAARFDPHVNKQFRSEINRSLAYEVVYQLSMNTECMPTHLVATFLLMYRQGITEEHLIERVNWLREQLMSRGAPVSFMEGFRRDKIVSSAVEYLRSVIIERRKGLYEPAISNRHEYSNMLVLSHYRNKIVPWFFREGLWACALYSFGEEIEQGVSYDALHTEVEFLFSLLQHEFIFKRESDPPEDLNRSLEGMIRDGTLIRSNDKIEVAPKGESFFSFLCAMFWPFIDSYFVTALTLFALQPNNTVAESKLTKRAQWLGTTLYAEGRLSFFEACSMDTLKNAVETLEQWKVVKRFREPGSSSKMAQLLPPYQEEDQLQSLVTHIGRFRKPAPVRPTSSRRNLIADIPILAKL